DAVLRRKREANAAPFDLDVSAEEGRHTERPVADVALRADPKPAQLDQSQRDRRDAFPIELVLVEMQRHRFAQRRKRIAETDELVVLRLLLLGPVVGAVEVLLSARGVAAGRLELRRRARRDPDVLPRRRDRERLEPRELPLVRDPLAAAVVVAE